MKYLILGLLLLGLILGFCLWTGGLLGRDFSEVETPLELACDAASRGDSARARALAEQAASAWECRYRRFAALLDHSDIDKISLAFVALADTPDPDWPSACKSLLSMLRNLEQADLPQLHNLL